MSVFLPIEKTSKALSCRTVTLGGLDLRECKEQESVASCLNLDSSHPRFLRGHKRWQDCSISVAGAKLQLGMFSLGSDLYVVGHDGSRVYHDPDNPRVEITITKMATDNQIQMEGTE